MEEELGQLWWWVSDMEAAVTSAWNTILDLRLEELIRKMPARMQAVIGASGYLNPS